MEHTEKSVAVGFGQLSLHSVLEWLENDKWLPGSSQRVQI